MRPPLQLLVALLLVPCGAEDLCSNPACHCDTTKPGNFTLKCDFQHDKIVELGPGSMPSNFNHVVITGGKIVKTNEGTFSDVSNLHSVMISHASNVEFGKNSFQELRLPTLQIEVHQCGTLTLSSLCFNKTRGYSRVVISKCAVVKIQKDTFSLLMMINITDVPSLVLEEGAFSLNSKTYPHSYVTKIHLTNVMMASIPSNTFVSSANSISMTRVEVGDVKKHAFSGITFNQVTIADSNLNSLQAESFKDSTLLTSLKIKNCTINTVHSEAIQSGVTDFLLYQNKIKEVESNAVNITNAKINITLNEIDYIRSKAFEIKGWDNVTIEHNSIYKAEKEIFLLTPNSGENSRFWFVNNSIFEADPGALKFVDDMYDTVIKVNYEKTFFGQECSCKMDDWLRLLVSKNTTRLATLAHNSYCRPIDDTFKKCFNVVENMRMKNFTERVCNDKNDRITCDPSTTREVEDARSASRFPNLRKTEESEEERAIRNKRILYLILLVATCGAIVIMIFLTIRWAKRKGYCIDVKNAIISSNNSCVIFFDRLFNINYGMDTARSISRLSINEYTESHMLNETRILELDQTEMDIIIETADKATQTLPEELTKELLESLREKLDDPENYSEAREMIEHLYDLIKVEECSTNTNDDSRHSSGDYPDDVLYDVIQTPNRIQAVPTGSKPNKVSVGTRVPSLDKLLPISPYSRQTALCHEYSEPKDKAVPCYSEVSTTRISDLIEGGASRPSSFLRAIGDKMNGKTAIEDPGPSSSKCLLGDYKQMIPHKMANRPLPEEPR